MPNVDRKSDNVSIVLIGSFNPAILQPMWLGAKGLLRDQESREAKLGVVLQDYCQFSTDWLQFQVSRDRFQVDSLDQSNWTTLRDLVIGIFKLLEHTPLFFMGINRSTHFEFQDKDGARAITESIVSTEKRPKNLKDPVIKQVTYSSVQKETLPDGLRGSINVTVEPSVHVPNAVFVSINNHFENAKEPLTKPIDHSCEFMHLLEKSWEIFVTNSQMIGDAIVGKGT